MLGLLVASFKEHVALTAYSSSKLTSLVSLKVMQQKNGCGLMNSVIESRSVVLHWG